ncbi:MAG: UbiH/UbiF/VisC/COQ6 family ubiquinone biosynthesis hydroxylase [Gammaproteobacteria bacterium]|nr:UbiH/UbiF/VisC/COQ6 family ubiquinone biosynthesis hydroxylase [Gammaproteobacteria bacterium]
MNIDLDFDVLIVGCGMVGASMALALRHSPHTAKLRIAIADRQAFDCNSTAFASTSELFDARVSALTLSSQQLLVQLGAWQQAQQMRVCPYQDMAVWDGEGNGSIHFSAAKIGQEQLGTIVENSVVQTTLIEQLNRDESIRQLIPFNIDSLEIEDNQCLRLTSVDGQQCRTRLLIGADGANSRIRELMAFPTREWDYQHTALVTTVRTEQAHNYTARQRFMASGPLAFLPLNDGKGGDQHHCSIVWSCVPERAEQLMSLSDEAFRLVLGHNFEHRLGQIEWCDKRFTLPLRQRHVTSYFRNNVVLIGDAAHTIHPLAGQGVNLGLLDVKVLAGELAMGIACGRAVSDPRLLSRYQRKRRGHNLGMMWLMEGFKHLFAAQPLPLQWLRNTGLNAVNNVDLVKHQLARHAIGLD